MAANGQDFVTDPTGQTAFGLGPDGRVYPVRVDADGYLLPAANEVHIGSVSGYGFDVVDTPATTNGAYSAGDMIGGYRTVEVARANDEAVVITGVQVTFKAAVQPSVRVIIFGVTPVASLADNGVYSLDATDVLKVRKSLSSALLGASYTNHGTPKSISLTPPPFVAKPIAGTKNIGYVLVDDTGVTLTSTADMQVRFSGLGA